MELMKIYFESIDLFITSLEPFIKEKRISFIPVQPLKEILDYFLRKNNLKII